MAQRNAAAKPIVSQPELPPFDEAVHQNWERIYSVLFRLTGDPDQAEDLALETFWRLWRRPPSDPAGLGGWLYRVALRLGFNALRDRRRRVERENQAGLWTLEEHEPLQPEAAAEAAADRQRVRQILRRLPERQAAALLLRHSGLSYREISAALGMQPNQIGKILERAERAFLRLYQQGE